MAGRRQPAARHLHVRLPGADRRRLALAPFTLALFKAHVEMPDLEADREVANPLANLVIDELLVNGADD